MIDHILHALGFHRWIDMQDGEWMDQDTFTKRFGEGVMMPYIAETPDGRAYVITKRWKECRICGRKTED